MTAFGGTTPRGPNKRLTFCQAWRNWQDGNAAYYCFTVRYVAR